MRGASDSVADFAFLSNPAGAQNISCLGLWDRGICQAEYFKLSVVSIYILNTKNKKK